MCRHSGPLDGSGPTIHRAVDRRRAIEPSALNTHSHTHAIRCDAASTIRALDQYPNDRATTLGACRLDQRFSGQTVQHDCQKNSIGEPSPVLKFRRWRNRCLADLARAADIERISMKLTFEPARLTGFAILAVAGATALSVGACSSSHDEKSPANVVTGVRQRRQAKVSRPDRVGVRQRGPGHPGDWDGHRRRQPLGQGHRVHQGSADRYRCRQLRERGFQTPPRPPVALSRPHPCN